MSPEQGGGDLAQRLALLEWRLQWAEWKISQLEKGAGATPKPAEAPPLEAEAPEVVVAVAAPSAPAPLPPPPAAAPAPFDWESVIGVRLFALLGGAALFVAAALFLNYSIQQNLISPALRVALGLVLGAGALIGGDLLRAKADRAGQAIGGAGAATLYASLFAAHSLWHLVPSSVAFVGMILVTLTAGVMAVKRKAPMLAVLGLVGGFLTPYFADTLTVAPPVLVAYLLVLSGGAWFAGKRVEVGALAPLAASFGALTLTFRVDGGLFPGERGVTLALFAALPVAWFGLWLARRRAPEAGMLRLAATIALAACALCVSARVYSVEASPAVAPLAFYAWVHVALLVAMGGVLESPWLLLGALGVAACSLLASWGLGFKTDRLDEALVVIVTPMLAFWSLPLFGRRFQRGTLGWAVAALSLMVHFPVLYAVAKGSWSDGALGASSVACGLLALGTLVLARKSSAEPESAVAAVLGGTSLLFFTAAVPILLSNEWLTVAWALEAAALAWLRLRVKHRGLLVAAGMLGGGTLARLLVNEAVLEYHPRSGTPILNWWLYSYGVSALALLAAWWFLGRDEDTEKSSLRAFFAFAGGLLLFVLLNVEIADFFSTGSTVTFQFSGGGFGQDMAYTLAWGVFSLALFGLGMWTRSKPLRIWAIGLVCATVAKGALHDVWSLGSLYRVGAIVGLAVTLLAVSYLTQRFVLRADAKEGPR